MMAIGVMVDMDGHFRKLSLHEGRFPSHRHCQRKYNLAVKQ